MALVLFHIVLVVHALSGTVVFHIFGEQVELSHPHYARDFYELYGQHIIVPCTNVWDMNQRTNCRTRLWGVGVDGWRPFVEWQVVSIDKNGNWVNIK